MTPCVQKKITKKSLKRCPVAKSFPYIIIAVACSCFSNASPVPLSSIYLVLWFDLIHMLPLVLFDDTAASEAHKTSAEAALSEETGTDLTFSTGVTVPS